MKHLKKYNESQTSEFESLKGKLLGYGGNNVTETYEEDLEKLINRGIFFDCESDIIKMKDSRCHFNASNFWKNYSDKNGTENVHIVTGWALSDDQTWRQHSWIWLSEEDLIIETTIERIGYYGFILTDEEANKFYWDNY